MSPRGYRVLHRVPRLQSQQIHRLVASFGTLQGLLAATAADLQSVDGIGAPVGAATSGRDCHGSPNRPSTITTDATFQGVTIQGVMLNGSGVAAQPAELTDHRVRTRTDGLARRRAPRLGRRRRTT